MTCLSILKEIVKGKVPHQDMIQIQNLLVPVINFGLTADGVDYLIDSIGILNLVIFNKSSILDQNYWFYLPFLAYSIIGLNVAIDSSQFSD